jgi:hypothetical protein
MSENKAGKSTTSRIAPLDIPANRGERINIDIITKPPVTTKGNGTIITIVDGLTKRVHWIAASETGLTAEHFAQICTDNYIRNRGVPGAIVADRDVRFTSDFWTALMKIMGTKLRYSTTFHPQADGLAERANGTVHTFLRAYAADNLQEWDQHLELAESTYNSSRHKVTKISPFEADIGYALHLPLDFLVDPRTRKAIQNRKSPIDPMEFARSIQERIKDSREKN